jgi:hypothetical protein
MYFDSEANGSLGVAVVKVTPSVGCVKYKAQHVVLAVRIPVLIGGKWPKDAKNGGFSCGFSPKSAKLVGFLRSLLVSNRASFEGRRDRGEGQGAGVVQNDVDGGGNVGKEARLVSEQAVPRGTSVCRSEPRGADDRGGLPAIP